jgi:hemolysin activation/secretion protein
MALSAMAALAATPAMAAVVPDAGQTERSTQERKLTLPDEKVPELDIQRDKTKPKALDQGLKIRVDHFRFTGQIPVREETLAALVQGDISKELSLSDMEAAALRITRYLRSQGFLVATAYIPAQEIANNTVDIAIVIGQYGTISVRNQSSLWESRASALLSGIHSGDYVKEGVLERAVLLADDTSGISARAILAPGKLSGTTDLVLDLKNDVRFEGSTTLDNYGNTFTGSNRFGLNFNVNNPGRIGDQFAFGSYYTGSGMDSIDLKYQAPVGNQSFKVGVEYSRSHYLLGKEFADLGAGGEASTTSFFGTYPFIRSRNLNLNGRIGFNATKLQDRQEATGFVSDKRTRAWSIGVNGNIRDKKGNGITVFALTYSAGYLNIDTPDDEAFDQASAKAAGPYGIVRLNLLRAKQINERLNYVLAFTGQLANKNLDSAEKLYLGGATGVRAYPQGEAGGDQGYLFTAELHWKMPTSKLQLAAFIDSGSVILNKNPWYDLVNQRTLTGAGLGVIWNWDQHGSLRLDYAWKLGSEPAVSDADSNGRFWLQCTRRF